MENERAAEAAQSFNAPWRVLHADDGTRLCFNHPLHGWLAFELTPSQCRSLANVMAQEALRT